MAARPLRRLVTQMVLDATRAFKDLKAYDVAWKAVEKTVDVVTTAIERNSDRMVDAFARVATAAANVRDSVRGAGNGGGVGGGGGAPRAPRTRTPTYGIKAGAFSGAKDRGRGGGVGDVDPSAYAGVADNLGKIGAAGEKAAKGVSALTVAAGNLLASGLVKGVELIASGLTQATKSAVEFESSMVDIAKVTRGADDTAEGLARIEKGILANARELGRAPKDIADLTAALAPVFTDGKADLVELSKEVVKIGVAWGVTGEQAGKAFADISRGLGLTADETKLLFGSINELSNKMGVKAADVADAVARSAGVIKAAGLSPETGAALNATLIAAGASADVAATGVRTFVARLESGEAATDKQIKAFETLGLDAIEVGKRMSEGGKVAEDQIQAVVQALSRLPKENQLPTLIELFGSESIGSIGAAATAVDTLGQSFAIAGNKIAAAGSVQAEFDKASKTSAFGIEQFKANIQVLGIELGKALLPTLNELTAWLNSPEGQKWGKDAVEGLIGALRGAIDSFQEAWPAIKAVGQAIASFVDTIGGGTAAVAAFGAVLLATIGPIGTLIVASTALGAYLGNLFVGTLESSNEQLEQMISNSTDVAKSLVETGRALAVTNGIFVEMADSTDKTRRRFAELMLQIAGTANELERFYKVEREGMIRNGKITEEEDRKRYVLAKKLAEEQRTTERAKLDKANRARRREQEAGYVAKAAKTEADERRFAELSARRRRGEQLSPSEAKEYTALSKGLDKAKATKAPKGGGKKHYPWEHNPDLAEERWSYLEANRAKLTPSEAKEYTALSTFLDRRKGGKMSKTEQELGGLDPALKDILLDKTTGKAASDPLSKAVAQHAMGRSGGDRASAGPGPSISNIYNNQTVTTSIVQEIDARGADSSSQNIANAGTSAGQAAATVVLTGLSQVLGLANAGGVLR